jgi:hypothetical protein
MPDFLKPEYDLSKSFIRGSARILVADMSMPVPTELNDVFRTATTDQDEVQTLTVTGTPTGGNFKLSFRGRETPVLAYNSSAANIQAALEALATIGTGGVVCTGGALPGTAVVITFANQLGGQSVPMITVVDPAFTGGTSPAAAIVETTAGFGQYDVQAGWSEIGATLGGIRVNHNNTEEAFSIDQVQADIFSQPTSWEMNVNTSVARGDIDMLQYLWEGGQISLDALTGERTMPLGTPDSYRQRRVVVAHQRPSLDGGITAGGIQAFVFRTGQRAPQEGTVAFNKQGDQNAVAFQWKIIADTNVVDKYARFGHVIDEK